MEKDAALPNDAPFGRGGTTMLPGGEPTTLARLSFYCDVLGERLLEDRAQRSRREAMVGTLLMRNPARVMAYS
jgi:hypothetical protein